MHLKLVRKFPDFFGIFLFSKWLQFFHEENSEDRAILIGNRATASDCF